MTDEYTGKLIEDAGFEFEQDDYETGINGGWTHWCPGVGVDESNADPSISIQEGRNLLHYEGTGGARAAIIEVTLLCDVCAGTVTYDERDWDPEFSEIEEELTL